MSDSDFYTRYLGVDVSPPAPPGQQPDPPPPADAQHDAGTGYVVAALRPGVTPTAPPDLNGQRVIGPAERPPQVRPAAPRHETPEHSPAGSSSAQQASASVGPLRASIRAADLVKPYKEVPESGWRGRLNRIAGINLGPSPAERAWNDLRRRVSRNLRGTYLVAVLQQKGGVAKTTATLGLGSALARYRDDKVVAIDANPASGNLAKRIQEPSAGTWRGLIRDERLQSYSDFRHYLGKSTSSGLEVLASDAGDEMLSGAQVTELWRRLQRQYPIGLVDCGTQLRDDVMAAVLAGADAVVVVSTTRLDGADGAAETLNWLVDHGYPHLVRSAVIVISDLFKVTQSSSVRKLHGQFEKAVRAVHYVPFDPHLSDAAAVDFDRLKPHVRRAFIEAAASLVDGFGAAADKDPGALPAPREPGDVR
ncbi:MinD/ParA family protein [Mycobacterium sp. SP-6446]|uniref:MinD/ParA family ATP-binding protein n=1 Tax=Mycobacterium sp. SP-6446 TaxID=1834162 RepID=UPI0020CA1280|nr:MinD/ParA family protein [Mycobacterium sp. SP-6446]